MWLGLNGVGGERGPWELIGGNSSARALRGDPDSEHLRQKWAKSQRVQGAAGGKAAIDVNLLNDWTWNSILQIITSHVLTPPPFVSLLDLITIPYRLFCWNHVRIVVCLRESLKLIQRSGLGIARKMLRCPNNRDDARLSLKANLL